MQGFAFPRRFKSAASLLPTLTRNNRELTNFLNSFVVRFNGDGSTLTLSGNVSIAGDLSGLTWQAWTPTYTNITIGNGTVTARFVQIGSTVMAQFKLVFGSTTSIDGSGPTVSLPVTALSSGSSDPPAGTGVLVADGGGTRFGSAYLASTTKAAIFPQQIGSTYLQAATVSATIPFTWGTADVYAFTVTYEVA